MSACKLGLHFRFNVETAEELSELLAAAKAEEKTLAEYAHEAVTGWAAMKRWAEGTVREGTEFRTLLEDFAREFRRAARPEAIGEGAEKMMETWNRLCERLGIDAVI